MSRKIAIILAIVFCQSILPFLSWAQNQNSKFGCGTDIIMDEMRLVRPQDYEAWKRASQRIAENMYRKTLSTSKSSQDEEVYVIPVVVHVIHNNGPEKISEAQVKSQFEALNRDFRKVPGTLGFGQGVDMKIEFCLASIDPNGKPTTGIVYKQSTATELGTSTDEDMKGLSRWNPNRYMNVYLVKSIGRSDGGGTVLGYAFFPMQDNRNFDQDGVVINYDSWGITGNIRGGTTGRVATHEFGHWMSLHHPFNDGCAGGSVRNCFTAGDGICDTPPSKGQNFGSPYRLNSCNNEDEDKPDNTRNYMDYTDDFAKDMFTQQQKDRSRAVFEDASFLQRIDLYSDKNNQRTGVGRYGKPTANFSVDRKNICPNQSVQFIDYSFNKPDKYFWSFPGGEPSISTEINPTVKYSSNGQYSVTLKVVNDSHPKDTSTLVFTDYIRVKDTTLQAPFIEGFEQEFPPKNWDIDNYDAANFRNNVTFSKSSFGAYGKSSNSTRLRYYYYSGYGQIDHLTSPTINLKGMKNASLKFSIAYRPTLERGAFPYVFTDSLNVWVSTNCGQSWERVFQKGGEALSKSKERLESVLVPEEEKYWSSHEINIDKFIVNENVKIRFEGINGNGNNLFIDDIELADKFVVSRPEINNIDQVINVIPNPFNQYTDLSIDLEKPTKINYSIVDIQGRNIYNSGEIELNTGSNKLPIYITTPGIYLVRCYIDGQIITKKIMNL